MAIIYYYIDFSFTQGVADIKFNEFAYSVLCKYDREIIETVMKSTKLNKK